ncbi:Ig-like domain-containing protein [Sporosarcina ureae]|uniref:Ig-like domain-containing protein n=1 Tax=Sporosarcina ureae TaxID=1571 RepID=UPI0009DC6D75|nr:Ig-like domain-containing protein [Sporosarcina ureae]ARF18015.1 hypothetical protein SporoP17a_12455 [Sporosarcina ureae]
MKKGFKLSLAAVLATSALTPVAAFAAENDVAANGLYNLATKDFVSVDALSGKTLKEKLALLKNKDVYLATNGVVYKGTDILTKGNEELPESGVQQDVFEQDNGVILTPEGEVVVPGEAVTVESVMAITAKTVTVNFNKLPEDLNKEDFKVIDKDNLYANYEISELKAVDGKLQLKLANGLKEDTNYQLVYNGAEPQMVDFTYEMSTPTAVNILTKIVATKSGNVQLKSEVLAGKADVTEDFEVTYTSDSTAVKKNGTVDTSNLTDGDILLVKATVGTGADAIESELQVVVAKDAMASSYKFFTIASSKNVSSTMKAEDAVTSLDSDYVNKATADDDKFIVPYVEDQFGNLVAKDADASTKFQFESLTPETMLVNENDGQILGVYQKGTAKVKVTAPGTNFEQIISVDVKAPAKADSFVISNKTINTVDTGAAQKVTVTVKDQYGNPVEGETVKAIAKSDVVSTGNATTNDKGEATLTIKPTTGKEGTTTVDVQVGNLDKQTVTVNVTKAGTPVDYEISNTGDDLVFDKNGKADDSLAFSVFGIDKNGNHTSETAITDVKFVVTDEDGTPVKTKTDASEYDVASADLAVGEYTLTATKNDFKYGTVDFKVVDTTSQLNNVTFNSKSFKLVGASEGLLTLLNGQGATLYDQFGEVIKTDDVKEKLKSSNIKDVVVANKNVVTANEDDSVWTLNGIGAGETTVNVVFNTFDKDGKSVPQTVAFKVKNTVDTAEELKAAISAAKDTPVTDTITLDGDIEVDEALVIDSSVILKGNGHNINNEIQIKSSNVTVEGLKLKNDYTDMKAINVFSSQENTYTGIQITNNIITHDGNSTDMTAIDTKRNINLNATDNIASGTIVNGNTIAGFKSGIFKINNTDTASGNTIVIGVAENSAGFGGVSESANGTNIYSNTINIDKAGNKAEGIGTSAANGSSEATSLLKKNTFTGTYSEDSVDGNSYTGKVKVAGYGTNE